MFDNIDRLTNISRELRGLSEVSEQHLEAEKEFRLLEDLLKKGIPCREMPYVVRYFEQALYKLYRKHLHQEELRVAHSAQDSI